MTVSPAVQPPPGNPRFPMVEAMRGIAIVLVVFCHASQMSGATLHASWGWLGTYAYFGVILFFAISGFLIYRPFVVGHAGRGTAPQIGAYARRRLLRILPAYWLALTILSLWPGVEGPLTHQWWVYYGFLQVYSVHTLTNGLAVAWSLCVEVTFYVLLPLLAAVVATGVRRFGSRSWWQIEAGVLAAFAVAGIVGQVLVYDRTTPYWVANTIAGTSDWFVGGMALAVVSVAAHWEGNARRGSRLVQRHSGLVWALGIATFVVATRVFDVRTVANGRPGVYGVSRLVWVANHIGLGLAAMLLLAPTVLGARGVVRRIASWRVLSSLGLISYGIFLWHFPLAAWLGLRGAYPRLDGGGLDIVHRVANPTFVLALTTLAVSSVVATLSYRFVELPFLRLKDRRLAAPWRAVRVEAPATNASSTDREGGHSLASHPKALIGLRPTVATDRRDNAELMPIPEGFRLNSTVAEERELVPDVVMRLPSMMSYEERSLLHWAARVGFGAQGTVVDAGCFLGGSTLPLGLGLARREADTPRLVAGRVHSFDLFQVGAERERVYFDDEFPFAIGASTIEVFERNIVPVRDRVTIHAGDINALPDWRDDISLLFVDIAKSWRTNDTIATRFFPCLVAGAIVIQQDLVHFGHPWCALTMELLENHLEYIGHVPFGSAVYRVISPISPGEIPTDLLNLLSADEAVRLIERCALRVGTPYEGFVRLAAGAALVSYGEPGRAREIAAEVSADYTDETLPWISEHATMLSQFADAAEAEQDRGAND